MLQILFQKKKNSTKVHTIKISFRCNYKPYLKKKQRGIKQKGKQGEKERGEAVPERGTKGLQSNENFLHKKQM